jgi:hypothetical protein
MGVFEGIWLVMYRDTHQSRIKLQNYGNCIGAHRRGGIVKNGVVSPPGVCTAVSIVMVTPIVDPAALTEPIPK